MLSKLGWHPGSGGMTTYTIQAKNAHVNFWLGVAGSTFAGCTLENLVSVAILARDGGVRPIQGKYLGMVKVGHGVTTVVAVQAGGAKERCMFGHKGGICGLVAGDTIGDGGLADSLCVAVVAGEGGIVVIGEVVCQAEVGEPFMIHVVGSQGGDVGLAPFVVGVAGLATAVIGQFAV